jgi:uncharacterized protein (DUF2249 family)
MASGHDFSTNHTINLNVCNPTQNKYMNTNIETENLIGPDRVMDVRPIPCSIKHGLIIRTWLELPVGEHFILLNDHDPVPLYYQFAAQWPGAFTWEHLVKGPTEFRVKITKLRAVVDANQIISGSCGHH